MEKQPAPFFVCGMPNLQMMVWSGINMQDQFGPKIEAWRDIEKEIQDN